MRGYIKFLGDITPIVVFFLLYKKFELITATTWLIIVTLTINLITFFINRKLCLSTIICSILLIIMGGITVYTGNSNFIKFKLTIINLAFALILFIGVFFNKGLLKHLFAKALKLTDKTWIEFSKRWALFFLTVAIINEIVWRNFSDETWVKFKVFGVLGCTLLFIVSQIPFLTKEMAIAESEQPRN